MEGRYGDRSCNVKCVFIIVCYERFVEASGVTLKICLGRGKEDGINECINYRLE